jgi:hypothetical protein
MKTKREFILALVATSMLVLAIEGCATHQSTKPTIGSAASTQPAVSLTINGTIRNYDEFVACVIPNTTYIQLVPLPANGVVSNQYDGEGHVTIVSNLDRWAIPKKAAFSFDVPSIPPGRYLLAAQQCGCVSGRPYFLTVKKQLFIVDIPADAKSSFTIKAGDLIVNTH